MTHVLAVFAIAALCGLWGWFQLRDGCDEDGGCGTGLGLLLTRDAPRAWHDVDPSGAELYGKLHPRILAAGTWMAPSAYEVAFVSTEHRPEHIERAAQALDRALEAVQPELAK